jgi:DnaK suppressor protein
MNKRDLAGIKRLLIEKKGELLNKTNPSYVSTAFDDAIIGDEIDVARQNSDKEMFFKLALGDKMTLNAINDALAKIEKNIYSTCECCGKKIPVDRLKAIPWTRYCIKCQEEAENPKR